MRDVGRRSQRQVAITWALTALLVGGCSARDPARVAWSGQAEVPAFASLINGTPTLIRIDSGYNGSLQIPLTDLERYHLTPDDQGAGESTTVSGDTFPWWRAGPLTVMVGATEVTVHWAEAQSLGKPTVGMEFLEALGAIIDCNRQALFTQQGIAGTAWVAAFSRDSLLHLGYRAIPCVASPHDQLLATGMIDDHRVTFAIDTGAEQTWLDRTVLAQWSLVDDRLETWLSSFHFSRDATGHLERLGASTLLTVTLGGVPIRRAFDCTELGPFNQARARNDGASGERSPPIAGIIGMDVLLALRAMIDLPARTLYLRPAR